MFRALILWKVTKNAYFVSLLLAFILLMIQIFRIGFILFGLPITSSIPFFLTWFVYYGFFFIPDGLIASVALGIYELKEKKLIYVLYSFHRSPNELFRTFMIPVLLFFAISTAMSFFLFEEHVSFARRGLLLQYKDRVLESIPERTFLDSGGVVIYTYKKEGEELRNIFLKYKNTYILAERARYEKNGRFVFTKGTLLTKERGKYFLMEFNRYRLDTEEFFSPELREKKIRKERIMNLANTLSILPFSILSFLGALRLCRTHTQVYYLIALGIVFHQLLLFGLKISL